MSLQKSFSIQDQNIFAKLSGDYNPLHLDIKVARKLIPGKMVVHGINLVLWVLDNYFGEYSTSMEIEHIKIKFIAPLGVGENATMNFRKLGEADFEAIIEGGGKKLLFVKCKLKPALLESVDIAKNENPIFASPQNRAKDVINQASGALNLFYNRNTMQGLYPDLFRFLPANQVAVLLATTRLVGMEYPGLHSIFSELTLSATATKNHDLDFEVKKFDERFSLIDIGLCGPNLIGEIQAFLRPKPLSFRENQTLEEVKIGEFKDKVALIIGGSRGIGEATSRLLTRGGASVVLTYYNNDEDAESLVSEIISAGGSALCCKLDITDHDAVKNLLNDQQVFTDLFYFATPKIFIAEKGKFNQTLFDKFSNYYVTSFANIVQEMVQYSIPILRVFYPSSISITEKVKNMGEYSAAKIAGEYACEYLENANKNIKIHQKRLPRIATDQTSTLVPVAAEDAMSLMLNILREMN
jgi:NADP-dependent 3-hydroxy acid dehydrogenase YdfG